MTAIRSPARRWRRWAQPRSNSLAALVGALKAPRTVWVMLPAGAATETTIELLRPLLARGDCLIDGGNSFWRDDVRRAKSLAAHGVDYMDVGVSGGVWGLTRGFCMMIGGPPEAFERLDPIFKALAPGRGDIPPTPGREGRDPRVEEGYLYAGPSGAGHFVKMVHNGVEYGLMQAYAEGFDILRNADAQGVDPEYRFTFDVADIAEVWRRGSVVSSWLLDLTANALAHEEKLESYSGYVEDFRRRALDAAGGARRVGAGGGALRRALRALPLAPEPHLRREADLGDAQRLRRPHRAEDEGLSHAAPKCGEAIYEALASGLSGAVSAILA